MTNFACKSQKESEKFKDFHSFSLELCFLLRYFAPQF
jgi:hypothetical protein